MDTILRNGKIVTSSGVVEGDLGVENGKIAALGKVPSEGKREIDCSGKYILPGVIDIHVHFRDPGFPEKGDFLSESKAAVAGGVTTVLDMPNTDPPALTVAALEQKRKIAAQKSRCNYGFYMGFTGDNLSEIQKAKNTAGVKIFLGSSTGNLLLENLNMLEKLFETGKFVIVHAEDERLIREHEKKYRAQKNALIDPSLHSVIRDRKAALQAVKTVLHAAKKTNARVHITHVSTLEEIEEIQKFKSPNVTFDVTPHHLFLNISDYKKYGNFVKVNPPLRTEEDRQALWKFLKNGFVDCVASDHAPHTKSEKMKPYWDAPAGVPGVQTLLPLLLDSVNHGELQLSDVVRLTAENPAKIFNIRQKGRLEVGYAADLSIIDMSLKRELTEKMLFSKCGWSPFTGRHLQGWPIMTLVKGRIAFENGKIREEIRGQEVVFR